MDDGIGATKVVNFGDVAYLRMLANWLVANEDGGGIAVYEDRPGSGTLRPWTEKYAFDDAATRDMVAVDLHDGHPTNALSERAAVSRSVSDAEEDGQALRLHRW